MKYVLLLIIIIKYANIIESKDCLSYYDDLNKLIYAQKCAINSTSCCGLCHIRFCCSVLSPIFPVLDQNKCENNLKRTNNNNSYPTSRQPQSDELDSSTDPLSNYGITVAIFVGMVFIVSMIFGLISCCIVYQKKRVKQRRRRGRSMLRAHRIPTIASTQLTDTSYVNYNSNSYGLADISRTQMPVLNVISQNPYKPHFQFTYDDPPPAYNTLKFN